MLIFLALKAGCIEQFTTSSPRLLQIFPIVQIDIYEYLGLVLSTPSQGAKIYTILTWLSSPISLGSELL